MPLGIGYERPLLKHLKEASYDALRNQGRRHIRNKTCCAELRLAGLIERPPEIHNDRAAFTHRAPDVIVTRQTIDIVPKSTDAARRRLLESIRDWIKEQDGGSVHTELGRH